jgi:hypothetical protein
MVENLDIENQKIKVRVNNFNEEHFRNLGYYVNKNEFINILVKELPSGSGLKIDVQCNYCGKTFKKSYRRYLETKDNLCCNNCRHIKMMETSLEKYGNKCSLRNEKILQKSKETNLKNLGVEYPFQNKKILEKCSDTLDKNGGREGLNVSKPQIYLHDLYGGILNYVQFPYRLDILFKNEKIYFEYDGSGHKLGIKFGILTEEEFNQKELKRRIFLKEKGYKEFRLIAGKKDKLPSKEILLGIKQRAFEILLDWGYSRYIYNLVTKTESFEE